jgi:PAS domain S-box-containing protein
MRVHREHRLNSPVRRVLLVEHDTAEAWRIRNACHSDSGALQVTHCASEDEAERILRVPPHRYDLLVLNLENSSHTGYERFLASDNQPWKPPVLMLANPGDEQQAAEWIGQGVADALIKDANGGYLALLPSKLTRVINSHFDSLARRRAENELRERAERNRIILDHVTEGIITLDERGNIESFNPAAETIFGYLADEVIGHNVKILMAVDDHDIYPGGDDTYLRHYIETGKGKTIGKSHEIMALRKNGSTFPAELTVDEVRFGGRLLFTSILRDITEHKLAEKALAQANEAASIASRTKNEFLANTSHELRTPLTAIIGFAEVIQNQMLGPLGNERYLEYITHISNSSHHLLELVEDILDASRIETGQLKLDRLDIDLTHIIEAVLRSLREQAQEAGLELSAKVAKDLPPVYADKDRVRQILRNLLLNAIKFTPHGGKVQVKACADSKGRMRITITDTGIGIAKQDIAKAFSQFGQVDGRLQRLYEGAGLGLPLVKSLVELHGGDLKLTSRVGQGTTVTIHFPVGRKQQTPHRTATAATTSPAAKAVATIIPLRRETG